MLLCFKNTMVSSYNSGFLLYNLYNIPLFAFQTAKNMHKTSYNQDQNIYETEGKAYVQYVKNCKKCD